MTISSSTNKVQFNGSGTTGPFAFTFKTFATTDLVVISTDADDVETTLELTTDYSVTLNGDQNNNPGGSVTTAAAVASGYKLTVVRVVDALQETDITNGSGFYPEVIENALDRLTMLVQQVDEKTSRAIVVDVSSETGADALLESLVAAATVSATAAAAGAAGTALAAAAAAAASAAAVSEVVVGDISSATHATTEKTLPVDADEFALIDSENFFTLNRLSWANIKATLKTYLDTLYAKVGAIGSSGLTQSTDRLLGRSTASTGAVEEITVGTGLSLSTGTLACTISASAFPAGTLMLFQQTAAPTGWTKQTTHNDKALRVVSGTASSGGTSAFSTVFGKTATDSHTLTAAQIPAHTHPETGYGGGAGYTQAHLVTDNTSNNVRNNTGSNTGGGGSHFHNIDIRVQYVDLIIASKDA